MNPIAAVKTAASYVRETPEPSLFAILSCDDGNPDLPVEIINRVNKDVKQGDIQISRKINEKWILSFSFSDMNDDPILPESVQINEVECEPLVRDYGIWGIDLRKYSIEELKKFCEDEAVLKFRFKENDIQQITFEEKEK